MSSTLPPNFPVMSIAQAHALLTAPGSPLEIEEVEIRGVRLKTWKNAPKTLRDVFAMTEAHKAHDALVYEGERVKYAGYRAAAIKFARQLAADGVQKGDRVAIVMRNLPE